jgi:hypothetical protein
MWFSILIIFILHFQEYFEENIILNLIMKTYFMKNGSVEKILKIENGKNFT